MADDPEKKSPRKASKEPVKWNDPTTWQSKTVLETLAYVLMIVGLVLLFTAPYVGGLLIGFVFALFFADEISSRVKTLSNIIETEGMVRSLLVMGLLLAFFISQPMIFIGAAVGVVVKNSIKNMNG